MSLIPFVFNMIDEPFTPVAFYPQCQRSLFRVPRWMRSPTELSCITDASMTKEGFQLCLDVQQFAPNEITVKTVDDSIVIEGKHEERQDEHGYVSRHFVRRYQLPKEYDVKEVVSTLSSDGVLTVKAPTLTKAIESNEKIIQIQQTGPAHLNIKSSGEKELEKKY